MKMLSSLLLTLVAVTALADIPKPPSHPVIEPGQIKKSSDATVEALDAMAMASAADLKKFLAAGNTITAATRQGLQPEQTSFTITRQQCSLGGIVGPKCLGGAQLQVIVSVKRSGEMVSKTAKSSVVLLRGM